MLVYFFSQGNISDAYAYRLENGYPLQFLLGGRLRINQMANF